MKRRHPKVWLIRLGVVAALVALFWFAPLFHVVKLRASQQRTASATFDASAYVEKLWNEQLPQAGERATDAATLLAAIKQDPKAARAKYGRGSEMASGYFYFVTGEGVVTDVTSDGVALVIGRPTGAAGAAAAPPKEPDIVLEAGKVFGNAVRDGSGLVDVSRFANSQDFNAISSELNRRIEERVIPPLREKAKVGATVRFAGCAEIVSDDTDLHPMRIVPSAANVSAVAR
jgi:predicted lipoprotein